MAERLFQVSLPEEVLDRFGWQESDVPRKVQETLVMESLRLDLIAEAEAAELLRLDRWELLEVMTQYRVPAVRLSLAELERELKVELRRSKSA